MEVLIRVATGLLIVIPGARIVHLCPNGTLSMLLKVHLWLTVLPIHLLRIQKAKVKIKQIPLRVDWASNSAQMISHKSKRILTCVLITQHPQKTRHKANKINYIKYISPKYVSEFYKNVYPPQTSTQVLQMRMHTQRLEPALDLQGGFQTLGRTIGVSSK